MQQPGPLQWSLQRTQRDWMRCSAESPARSRHHAARSNGHGASGWPTAAPAPHPRERPLVTATPKPPINAAIATISTDPAAGNYASSKQPRKSQRSVLQRCGEVVSKQACARLLNPGWGLSSSEGRLYLRRAVRSVLAEPLPAFLAASKSLALGHAGTHKEESVAAAPTV